MDHDKCVVKARSMWTAELSLHMFINVPLASSGFSLSSRCWLCCRSSTDVGWSNLARSVFQFFSKVLDEDEGWILDTKLGKAFSLMELLCVRASETNSVDTAGRTLKCSRVRTKPDQENTWIHYKPSRSRSRSDWIRRTRTRRVQGSRYEMY